MPVSHEDFIKWLGRVQHENADLVLNVRDVGREAPGTFYVGRAMRGEAASVGVWGNPYREWKYGRFGSIRKFTAYVQAMSPQDKLAYLGPVVQALADGKRLLCWCAPDACHAHVLAGFAKQYMSTHGVPTTVPNERHDVPSEESPEPVVETAPEPDPTPPELPLPLDTASPRPSRSPAFSTAS